MITNQNHTSPKTQTPRPAALRFATFSLVFITIIALGAVAYFTEHGIAVSRDWVIHTYQVRSQLNDLQLEVERAQANQATYLLMQESKKFQKSLEQSGFARQTVDELRRLTLDNPRQRERLNRLGQLLEETASLVKRRPGSRAFEVQLSDEERTQEDEIGARDKQIDSIVKTMQDEEESLLEQRLRSWDHLFKRNVLILALAFGVVTLMVAHNFRVLVTEVAHTKDEEKHIRDNAESYRLMSARVLELQDSERRRIARELHDSVGQYLAGLKINLSQLETRSRIERQTLIRETIGLTDYAIQEVRTMSHLLHPPLLEELGFLPAARWYVDEYGKRSQIQVSLRIDEPIERLPKAVEVALFRVLQEALTNVYRHAGAQSVDVRILCHGGYVILTVADNGKGIPYEILAKFRGGAAPGIGLAGMRERLAEFGGKINVESSRGGTVVEAMIPTNVCTTNKESLPPAIGI